EAEEKGHGGPAPALARRDQEAPEAGAPESAEEPQALSAEREPGRSARRSRISGAARRARAGTCGPPPLRRNRSGGRAPSSAPRGRESRPGAGSLRRRENSLSASSPR